MKSRRAGALVASLAVGLSCALVSAPSLAAGLDEAPKKVSEESPSPEPTPTETETAKPKQVRAEAQPAKASVKRVETQPDKPVKVPVDKPTKTKEPESPKATDPPKADVPKKETPKKAPADPVEGGPAKPDDPAKDDDKSDEDEQAEEYNPSVSVSSSTVAPGDTLSINGSGFAPGESVDIAVSNGENLTSLSAKASQAGGWDAQFTVPIGADGGDYTVEAIGNKSNQSTKSSFTVDAAQDDPILRADPNSNAPGDSVNLELENFDPNGTETISVAGPDGFSDSLSAKTDDQGSGTTSWTIPKDAKQGTYTFSVGETSASIQVYVADYNPKLNNVQDVKQGDEVTISGSGYKPGDTVTVNVEGFLPSTTTAEVNEQGEFTVTLPTTLLTQPGDYPFTVTDGEGSNLSGSFTVTEYSADPEISPDKSIVSPGESFVVNGSGFGPNVPVKLTFQDRNGNVQGTVSATSNVMGGFRQSIDVASGASPGRYDIIAQADPDLRATTSITVRSSDEPGPGDNDGGSNGGANGSPGGSDDGNNSGSDNGSNDGSKNGNDNGSDNGVSDGANDGSSDGSDSDSGAGSGADSDTGADGDNASANDNGDDGSDSGNDSGASNGNTPPEPPVDNPGDSDGGSGGDEGKNDGEAKDGNGDGDNEPVDEPSFTAGPDLSPDRNPSIPGASNSDSGFLPQGPDEGDSPEKDKDRDRDKGTSPSPSQTDSPESPDTNAQSPDDSQSSSSFGLGDVFLWLAVIIGVGIIAVGAWFLFGMGRRKNNH